MTDQKDDRSFILRIDGDDRIVFVNDEWVAFALENDTLELTRDRVLHTNLFAFITNLEVRELYRTMLMRVRLDGIRAAFSFRCDSPSIRRFMHMEIYRTESDEVEFKSRIVKQETRDPVPILLSSPSPDEDLIVMCSWCKKVKTDPDDWREIEEAIDLLKLFSETAPPPLSHGLCATCQTRIYQELFEDEGIENHLNK